jgi:molybdopterin/thiamine biosynthesis adenylyltransferase
MNPLSENEKLLYQRQIGIESWDVEVQNKLKNTRVFVAGAGGLGSPVLFYLAAAGVGNITFCDSDAVELNNLNRQIIHSYESISIEKTESARQKLQALNPFINLYPIKAKITRRNARELVGDSVVIVDCLDNFKTRFILNDISIKNKIPFVHGGVEGFNGQVTFLHPGETACLGCIISPKEKKAKIPIVGVTAGIIGSIQATEVIKYITGIGENLKNRILFYDGKDMRFEVMNLKRNPRCKYCS